MKSNNYFLPSLLAGFAVSALTFIPGLKNAGCCCLLIPAASVFALFLFRKASNSGYIEVRDAVSIGLLTGVISALFSTGFDLLFTLIYHTNDLVESLPQTEVIMRNWDIGDVFDFTFELLRRMSREIKETGFSPLYSIFMLISNLVSYTVFAFIGALIGRSYFNRRMEKE
jgi:hypothetical protein